MRRKATVGRFGRFSSSARRWGATRAANGGVGVREVLQGVVSFIGVLVSEFSAGFNHEYVGYLLGVGGGESSEPWRKAVQFERGVGRGA